MLRYFDRAFFHFLFGFMGIIAVSFLVLLAVGFYEVEVKPGVEAAAIEESMSL